jgi:hypothetical protein
MASNTMQQDSSLGWVPSIPCPFYVWQFWKWQKVRCQCGRTFVSRNLGLMPPEYERHFAINHIEPVERGSRG